LLKALPNAAAVVCMIHIRRYWFPAGDGTNVPVTRRD